MMGDEIIIYAIEIIQNGLLQIDFRNENTNDCFRAFCEPKKFFGMFGKAMQKNFDQGGSE